MLIPGPTGNLEARIDEAQANNVAINKPAASTKLAVLCHPHPQYGGSMHDAVLETAAQSCLTRGYDCIRFNFRGVGASEGSYDNGVGEMQDLLAVHSWATSQSEIELEILWIGYSFGAAVTWQALQSNKANPSPKQVILIAPPTAMMPFDWSSPIATPVNIIAGGQDSYVDLQQIGKPASLTSHVIESADHFFSACHVELGNMLNQILAPKA